MAVSIAFMSPVLPSLPLAAAAKPKPSLRRRSTELRPALSLERGRLSPQLSLSRDVFEASALASGFDRRAEIEEQAVNNKSLPGARLGFGRRRR